MRIDLLPTPSTPVTERNNPGQEQNQSAGAASFEAVMEAVASPQETLPAENSVPGDHSNAQPGKVDSESSACPVPARCTASRREIRPEIKPEQTEVSHNPEADIAAVCPVAESPLQPSPGVVESNSSVPQQLAAPAVLNTKETCPDKPYPPAAVQPEPVLQPGEKNIFAGKKCETFSSAEPPETDVTPPTIAMVVHPSAADPADVNTDIQDMPVFPGVAAGACRTGFDRVSTANEMSAPDTVAGEINPVPAGMASWPGEGAADPAGVNTDILDMPVLPGVPAGACRTGFDRFSAANEVSAPGTVAGEINPVPAGRASWFGEEASVRTISDGQIRASASLPAQNFSATSAIPAQDFSEVPPAASFTFWGRVRAITTEWAMFAKRASAAESACSAVASLVPGTPSPEKSSADIQLVEKASEHADMQIPLVPVERVTADDPAGRRLAAQILTPPAPEVTAQDVESSPVAVIPSGPRPGSEAAVAVALLSGNTNPEDQKNEGAPQSPAERRREGVHGKETSPVQQSAKTDAAGCTWTEIPPAPRASFPVQAARAGSDDSDMTSSLHPGQKLPAKESAAFAGANPPSQPAAAEFKALAALIGPRPGAVMQEPALISQLADRIQMQVRDGQEIVRIQLKPSSLGWIEVRAGSSSAGIVATIMTESAGVKAYLENNLHQLQQTFQDQGLKIDRINVVVQPDGWHQHASSAFQESRSGSGENGDAATSSRQGGISRQPAEEQIMDLPNTPALAPNSTFHTIA